MLTEGECIFTINLGQSNLTISLFITTFLFTGPRLQSASSNNYLKVNQVFITIVNSKYVIYTFLFQVYDGPSISSPLVTTLRDKHRTPYPVFSTGPSLTMAYKTTHKWIGLLDMSYTSTDQGRMSAITALYLRGLYILLTCVGYKYRQRLRWKNVQY